MTEPKYTEYYIAFLDILGFKDKVTDSSVSCEDILKIYDFLSKMSEIYFGEGCEDIKSSIRMKIMSDSICIYIKADISNALLELVRFCVAFQGNLLILDPCVFIRGGITYGDMYARDDIMFGPALTEAYMIEEQNAKVPRIIMCKKTLDYGKDGMKKMDQQSLDSFIFRDDDAFYSLNYFWALSAVGKHEEELERVNMSISKWLDTTINESIRQKYLYVDKHLRKYLKENTNA